MVRASVIGLGRVGFEFSKEENRVQPASHVGCYRKLGFPLAVCDIDRKKLEAVAREYSYALTFEGGADLPDSLNSPEADCFREETGERAPLCFFENPQKMFERFKPEIVSICTPTSTHLEFALMAAKTRSVRTIFLEKPIASSVMEADAIINACHKYYKPLAVNYSRRWANGAYAMIRKQWDSHKSGTLLGIHPGPLLRTGTHMIDLFNQLVFPHPRVLLETDDITVQAFGLTKTADYMKDTDDCNLNGTITYSPEVTATLLGNVAAPAKSVVFELDAIQDTNRFHITDNGEKFASQSAVNSRRYKELLEYEEMFMSRWLVDNPLETAINDISEGKWSYGVRQVVACSGEDAKLTLQIALGLHYSSKHRNKKVKLKNVPSDYTVRSY